MHWLGRVGLLARGAIYAIVGVLAFKLAIGDGGRAADQQGALKTLAEEDSGTILLAATAAGLAAYATWRLASAWRGGDGFKERVTALISGIAYGLLCVTAVQILLGFGSLAGGAEDKATGGVFELEHGRQIVGVIGGIVVIEGVAQLVHGLRRKFCEKSRTAQMHAATEKAFVAAGVLGYCARGVVFGLIGAFLIKAAIDYDADEAIALDGALAKVADATAGPLLLGAVAVGLMAFALYCVFDARYREL